jgi:hypothetical protein
MISKYLATLAAIVLLLSLGASTMKFAARSQVLSGKAFDETFQLEFTIDADSTHTYRITPQLQAALEQGTTLVADGAVRVVSSSVAIAPKDVSWTENRTTITSPGAGLVAHVKWDTPSDSPNGAHGFIYIHFPEVEGLTGPGVTFHSGGYEKDNQNRYVLREVNTYRTGMLLSFALFVFALAAGVPVGIVLHSIFWGFQLKSEKRSRLAALPPQGSELPRTFYPNPVAEWIIWTIIVAIAAFAASIMAVISALDGFMGSSMVWAIYIILGIGAVIALICAYFTGRALLTVRVDANGISYARGRGDLQWITAAWADILLLSQKSRTYRGTRREWVELEFKDMRKKLKLQENIEGYPTLRDFLLQIFTPSK